MSLSIALNTALSGLDVTTRQIGVTATNIANVGTPGYARRILEQSSSDPNFFGGVRVAGIERASDPSLIAARRDAQTDRANANILQGFATSLEDTLGTPDDPSALSNLFTDFEGSLIEAASRPDEPVRLQSALNNAEALVISFREASKSISQMRSNADADINVMVTRLNDALEEVEFLNTEIARSNVQRIDASALLDLRQTVIDEIHEITPVQLAQRDNGKVALYAAGGQVLIDGTAQRVEFNPTNIVTPYQSLAAGTLSGLTIGGQAVNVSSSSDVLSGGRLSAQFEVRDELAVRAQSQLDAAARDLVERFQDPTVDTTLVAGDAGLFTDGGAAFAPADEIGLSERLELNAAIDPDQGGELWRLRDGINAAVPGPVGSSALLDNLRSALMAPRTPASGDFGSGALSTIDITTRMMSDIGVQRLSADQRLSFSTAAFYEAEQAEMSAGVDTDQEISRLVLLENAYAANARVMQVATDLLDELMRIG